MCVGGLAVLTVVAGAAGAGGATTPTTRKATSSGRPATATTRPATGIAPSTTARRATPTHAKATGSTVRSGPTTTQPEFRDPSEIPQGPLPGRTTLPARPMPTMLAAFPQFSQFLAALKSTGLDKDLAATGPYTVFVPDNGAFDALPAKFRDELLRDKAALRKVLQHHIVKGRVDAVTLIVGADLPGLDGSVIRVRNADDKPVLVDGAPLRATNIVATNGLIHVIGGVIYPTR